MELLSAATEKKLLETSLESLHEDSIIWLKTVSFWQDEIHFYNEFLHNRLFPYISKEDKNTIMALLSHITYDKLNFFEGEILRHEKSLNQLLGLKRDGYDFRHKHKLYLQYFLKQEEKMQQIKLKVFGFYKSVCKNPSNENEVIHTIYERRAIRKYKKEPVDKMRIKQIILAGKMAPTAMNQQLWKFYVLTDAKKIRDYSNAIYKVAKNSLNFSFKEADSADDIIFHGAPAVIFITAPIGNEFATLDIGMCAQNIMLAAKSLGYDSCPVGLAKYIEKTECYHELNIPASDEIKLAIVLGYGNEKPDTRERKNNNLTFLN